MLAIVLVLPAAVANATALVLLRKATEAEDPSTFSLPMLWVLVRRRPVWGAGIAAMATGAAGRITAVLATWPDLGADRGRHRRLLPAAERPASRPTGRLTIRHHPGQPGRRLIWGTGLFHEHIQTGWWLAGAGLGTGLLTGGAMLLSRSPSSTPPARQRTRHLTTVPRLARGHPPCPLTSKLGLTASVAGWWR